MFQVNKHCIYSRFKSGDSLEDTLEAETYINGETICLHTGEYKYSVAGLFTLIMVEIYKILCENIYIWTINLILIIFITTFRPFCKSALVDTRICLDATFIY